MPKPPRPPRVLTFSLQLPEEWARTLKKAAGDKRLSMHEYVRAMFESNEQFYLAAQKLGIELPRLTASKKRGGGLIIHPELREHFRSMYYPEKPPRQTPKKYKFDATKPEDWDDENE